ncbi:hypothetical protein CSHISOI_06635 [Colletotrichum shisoi]|uniref:Uncharacterized protein n=1 Tax=Colletotrichum shisoi TaxID=2078593 RepID=A0A5Q4BPC5_9PEZI|nr:hypothetical protein CSHISOI_06635 [Colletotrichum shisoi]
MKFTKHISPIIFVAAPIAAQTASESDLYSLLPIDLPPSVTLPVETDGIGTDGGGCPTVTSVAERCATCPTPHCLSVVNLTQSCGCPTPAPTEYITLSCREICARIGCSTSYAVVPGEVSCDGSVSGTDAATATATATVTEVVPTASVTESGSPTESGTESGAGASASASGSPTPNAARRLGVPFKFW